jgi:hypothetical protein
MESDGDFGVSVEYDGGSSELIPKAICYQNSSRRVCKLGT